jgi:hypothetical protein
MKIFVSTRQELTAGEDVSIIRNLGVVKVKQCHNIPMEAQRGEEV